MPITIGYQPAAGAIAGPALLAGQGQYAQWANQYLNNQYQFGANLRLQQQQMVMDRLNALNQMANQQAMQQNQQAFQMQMAPMQSMLDAQQQAYQAQLHDQSNYQQQILHAQLGSQQSRQDFSEQQQIEAQKAAQNMQAQAAHVAQQQAGELANRQAMSEFQQNQQVAQQFQTDPLKQYKQNVAQAQQAGWDYSPAQQQDMDTEKSNLAAIQSQISRGELMLPSALPQIKQSMARLAQISSNPEVAKPPTTAELVAQKTTMGIRDPQSGEVIPGTENLPMTLDPEGTPMVVRGYKPEQGAKADETPLVDAKVQGQQFKNETARRDAMLHRAQWITKEVQARAKDQFLNAAQIAELRNQVGQEYDQMLATGAATSVPAPEGMPKEVMTPPAPGITGANPQGPAAAVGAPADPAPEKPPREMSKHPSQVTEEEKAVGIMRRLEQTPRDRWTRNDWMLAREARLILDRRGKEAPEVADQGQREVESRIEQLRSQGQSSPNQ